MSDGIVKSLAEAKVGDTVLHFEPERSFYREGKYVGRGVWSPATIMEETRASFVTRFDMKFDRKTGVERGRKVGYPHLIAGEAEIERFRWRRVNGEIAKLITNSQDIDLLKAVAALVGFEPGPVEIGDGR